MNYKELSKVVDAVEGKHNFTPKTKDELRGLVNKLVKDSDNTFESEMEVLTNKLWEAEGRVKYPDHWTEDQKRHFDIAFEDFQLDDSPEDIKLQSDGEYVWLELDEDDEEIEDSVKKVKGSFSPQMYELIEGFENMPDDVDEVEVKTSSEVPQNEIDEFVKLYLSHYPEEEFRLSIEPLGDNLYKIRCPLA